MKQLSVAAVGLVTFLGAGTLTGATAQPAISTVSGEIRHGSILSITGSAFGKKQPASPFLWAPMDEGTKPSSLGLVTEWTLSGLAFASGEGSGRGGALKAVDNSGVWTARVDSVGFNWNDPGQKSYLYRKLKRNFDIFDCAPGINVNDGSTVNWKTWRVWGADFKGYTTIGIWNGNLSAAGPAGSLESLQSLYPIANPRRAAGAVGEWFTNEMLVRSNTNAIGPGDGYWAYIVNGLVEGTVPYSAYDGSRHFKMWDADNPPSFKVNFVVHEVKANASFPADWRSWADDVYVDTTWARVMIGDAPTLENSKRREIQIPTAWSDGGISVVVNLGAFPAESPMYLFVIDESNVASAGYQLRQSSRPNPPQQVIVQ